MQMKIGDQVRDKAELGGVIEKIVPGNPCRVLVLWNNGVRSWIDAKNIRLDAKATFGPIEAIRADIRKLFE